MVKNLITGVGSTRRVFINGIELWPDNSQACRNHSPDGFNWGYAGSGPSQLALAILLHYLPDQDALRLYQQIKFDVIATLTIDKNFELPVGVVIGWIDSHK